MDLLSAKINYLQFWWCCYKNELHKAKEIYYHTMVLRKFH